MPDTMNPQEEKKTEAQKLLDKIYSTNIPEPVFDQAKADRLQRMGRINQVGNGVSVLGDMLASGLGATVKRRQPDGVAAGLYQSFEQNLDKYKNDIDTYSLRKMSKNLDDAKLGLGEARRAEQLDFQNRKQADWMKAKEADNKLNWAKWSAEYDLKQKNLELQREKAGADAAYKNTQSQTSRMNAESNRIRAEKAGASTQEGKKFVLYEDNGKPLRELNPGEEERIVQLIMKDPEIAESVTEDIGLMKATFGESLSKQNIRTIISHYWNKSPEVKKYLGVPEASQGTSTPTTAVPQAKPTVDYTKLVY